MTSPITTLDQRYSAPDAVATTWEETRLVIEGAELFCSPRFGLDGRPHCTPVVAAWSDDALHFTTGGEEQKAANLRANSHVILTTGRNDWQAGLDIVCGRRRYSNHRSVSARTSERAVWFEMGR